jgi:FAD/FMN-containing dehydrogenase
MGVTLPAGVSPEIGIGGHVLGGAFGFLCRQHGLAADPLYGVEVVVVDEPPGSKRCDQRHQSGIIVALAPELQPVAQSPVQRACATMVPHAGAAPG